MKERLLFIATALALICYACGGDDGGAPTTPIENPAAEQAAEDAVDSTKSLRGLDGDPTSSDALNAMSEMYGDLSAMASAGQTGLTGFPALTGDKAPLETCVTATDALITYDNCDYGATTIDGTVGVDGDTVTTDLTLNSASGGVTVGFTMVGSIAVNTSLVDGSIVYDTNFSGIEIPGGAGALRLEANYDAIGLDGTGCPTSGSLTVSQSYSGTGGFDFGDVRAEFGPNCGDVQLFN